MAWSQSDMNDFDMGISPDFDWGGSSYGDRNEGDGNDRNRRAAQTAAAPAAPTTFDPTQSMIDSEFARILGLANPIGTNYFTSRGINEDTAGQFWSPMMSRFGDSVQQLRGNAVTQDGGTFSAGDRPISQWSNPTTNAADGMFNPVSNDVFSGALRSDVERMAAEALAAENSAARILFGNQVDNAFQQYDPQMALPYTMDDPYLDAILGNQKQDALGFLDRAKSRGQLSDSGFASAMQNIGDQAQAGRQTLEDLGRGIIDQGRGNLRTIRDSASTAAGGFNIGQTFDLGQFTGQADTARSDFTSNLESSIKQALGGQQLFDTSNAVQFGGQAQGVYNPVNAGTLQVAIDNDRERSRLPRGVGNEGVF